MSYERVEQAKRFHQIRATYRKLVGAKCCMIAPTISHDSPHLLHTSQTLGLRFHPVYKNFSLVTLEKEVKPFGILPA